MAFTDFKKDFTHFHKSSSPKEIRGVEAFSSLALLFEKIFVPEQKSPQILVAPDRDLKKIKKFLLLKKPKFSWFDLPAAPLTNSLFAEKIWNQRRLWQSWAKQDSPSLFLTTPLSLLKKSSLKPPFLLLKKGDTLEDFEKLGYKQKSFVEKVGDFSQRGFLLDIYSPSYSSALRLELMDDKILHINLLSKDLKKREDSLEEALISSLKEWQLSGEDKKNLCQILKDRFTKDELPFREDLLKKISRGDTPFGFESILNTLDETCSLDFFSQKPTLWILEPENTKKDFEESLKKIEEEYPLFKKDFLYLPWKKLTLESQITIHASAPPFTNPSEKTNLQINHFHSKVLKKPKNLKTLLEDTPVDYIIFVSQNLSLEKQIKQILFETPLENQEKSLDTQTSFQGKTLVFLQGILEESFFSEEGSAYLQSEHVLPQAKQASQTSTFEFFRQQSKSLEFSQMEQGDLVVHRQHGVAQFEGLKTLTTHGQTQDFFVLLYQKGDKLFLPAHKAKEIKRYSRKSNVKITKHLLDRLGDPRRWETKKSQAKKHIQSIALDLMNLYKKRKQSFRKPFQSVAKPLEIFAQAFPFEETLSQKKVIKEVLADMDQSHPMDRLLCADVGFGKTEVALRASFRALENQLQVCFLAPTTLLSLQHYENFKLRFKNWPFRISLLNRFNSEKQKKEIFKNVQNGKIDFLIATHSVFSPHLFFKNLGLLIIDEEHRFGVKQKERLSRFKHNLDTLSLSATPIPRTLNMALSGIKDISVLSTAPAKRKPIKTFLKSWDEGIEDFIVESCKFEKNRGGQILFVHNRIKSIYQRAEQLQKLLPNFKIACVHGNMKSSDLEKIILDFFEKKFDLLLATNIIESGMDIPQANTIFIDRVHEMGLSQIYQLKGRVGRAEQQAYCYLLIPRREGLSSIAKERLSLLEKHQSLGAGFQLALHDLETRGAGSLFGGEQSGHLHALGEDLFFEILNESLEDQKEGFVDPEINLPLSIGIPSSYIPDSRLRLLYYKSLSEAEKTDRLENLKQDLLENFGAFPEDLKNLFSLLKIKSICKNLLIRDLKVSETCLTLVFHEKAKVPLEKVLSCIETKGWGMPTEHSLKIPIKKEEMFLQIENILKEF